MPTTPWPGQGQARYMVVDRRDNFGVYRRTLNLCPGSSAGCGGFILLFMHRLVVAGASC